MLFGDPDHGFEVRPESRTMKRKPSEYLRQIWFDSLVYSSSGLEHLVREVGASQVVIGTDYPFDMGDHAGRRGFRCRRAERPHPGL